MDIIQTIIFLLKPLKIVFISSILIFIIFSFRKKMIARELSNINTITLISSLILFYIAFNLFYELDILFFAKIIISLPLIFFSPGYILYSSQRNNNLNFFEIYFLFVLGSILISGLIGLVLAEVGIFSLSNLLISIIIFDILLVLINRNKMDKGLKFPTFQLNKESIIIFFIVFSSISLYFHPFEWILGGRDPGVYVNTGVNIAKTGDIIIYDPSLKELDENEINQFYRKERKDIFNNFGLNSESFGNEILINIKDFADKIVTKPQFPGYYITDFSTGKIVPQFYYLYPVWIAIFYSIFGLKTALYITPLFSLFGVIAIIMVGRLIHPWVGYIAGFLFSINFAQIWFSRFPSTEPLSLFLIFSGIFTFFYFIKTNSRYFGFISALSFGQIFLTRIDGILLIIPVIIYLTYLRIKREMTKDYLYFITPFVFISGYALISAFFISTPYTLDLFMAHLYKNLIKIIQNIYSVIISLILLLIFIFYLDSKRYYLRELLSFIEKKIVYVQFIILSFFLVFFIYISFFSPGGFLHSENPNNLIKLSWYLGGYFGIFIIFMGFSLLLLEKPNQINFFLISLTIIYSLIFLKNAMIASDQPWWSRRYLQVVIPIYTIFMSYFIYRLWINPVKLSKYLSSILFVILTALIFFPALFSLNYVEYDGSIDDLDEISNEFQKTDILYFFKNDIGLRVATPLYYIYDINAKMVWNEETLDVEILENRLIENLEDNKSVFLINPPKEIKCSLNKVNPKFLDLIEINFAEMERPRDRLPRNVNRFRAPFIIYQLEKPEGGSGPQLPYHLQMGVNDECFINGFYGPEFSDNIQYRWTGKSSKIMLPLKLNRSFQLSIALGGHRPPTNPGNITVLVNDYLIENFLFPGGDQLIKLYVPQEYLLSDRVEIEFRTNTWNPGRGDDRDLGIAIYYVELS